MKPVVVVALISLSGCTLWFGLTQDPADIPCAEAAPFCLEGFTCVTTADDQRLCRRAAALPEGEPCVGDGECEIGLVCNDAYEPAVCPDDVVDDPNCNAGKGTGLRCRQTCDPASSTGCPAGLRCYGDGATGNGFCQAGTCSEGNECGQNSLNNNTNLCFDVFNGAGSGLCLNQCDPFSCQTPGVTCSECPALDLNSDGIAETWGCLPILAGNQVIPDRYGCVPVGAVPAGGNCAALGDCAPGAFCTTLITGQANGFCSQYCSDQGPACDVGNCTGDLGGGVGFCQ